MIKKKFIVYILNTILLTGCLPKSYILRIEVQDSNEKKPIENVKDVTYKTNQIPFANSLEINDGIRTDFSINSKDLPINISIPDQLGYFALDTILTSINSDNTIIIHLKPKETIISGVLYDASDSKLNTIIPDCDITFDPPITKGGVGTTTDATGNWKVRSVSIKEDNSYTVHFRKAGYFENPKTGYYIDLYENNSFSWKLNPEIITECWVCDILQSDVEYISEEECKIDCLNLMGECELCPTNLPSCPSCPR